MKTKRIIAVALLLSVSLLWAQRRSERNIEREPAEDQPEETTNYVVTQPAQSTAPAIRSRTGLPSTGITSTSATTPTATNTITQAAALSPAGKPKIVLLGLPCSGDPKNGTKIRSYSIAGANDTSVSIGGTRSAGVGKVSGLTIVKPFDECSPYLVMQTLIPNSFDKLSLVQSDSNGPLTEIDLELVYVSEYQVTASELDAKPSESVTFEFKTVRMSEKQSGASKEACWDAALVASCAAWAQ